MNNYKEKYSLDNQKMNIDTKGGDLLASSITPSLIFGCIAAVCSLVLPTAAAGSRFAEILSWIVCMISAFCIVVCSKRFFITVVAAIFASFIISAAGSTIPVALMLGLICSISFGSAAISRKKSNVIIALFIPIMSYLLSLLITRDFIISLASLIPLPVALTLGIANRKKLSKSSATVAGTVSAVITALLVMSIVITVQYGALTPDTISTAAFDLGYTFEYYLKLSIISAGNSITPEISHEMAEFTDILINTLPGAIVASCFSISYVCQSMSLAASERIGEDVKSGSAMSASLVTALVFLLAYLVSFATDASGNIAFYAIVANNIAIMLTPCLFIIGLRSLKLMPFKLGLIGLILTGAVFVFIFLSSSSVFTVLALTGALYTAVEAIDAWAKEHYSKGESK